MGKAEVIRWRIERPGKRKLAPDVWSLSAHQGAVGASRKGAAGVKKLSEELAGPHQLERFGPMKDPAGRLWPPSFRHNPWTGEALTPALETLTPMGGRFGSESGLPRVDSTTAATTLDISSKTTESLERGAFFFAQGGAPGFLYAADLLAGVVYRKSRLGDGWVDHGTYPHSALPAWAGGMCGSAEGVFYSGQTALVRLNEDPEDDGAETYPAGTMISSPAALPEGIAAPYSNSKGLGVGWLGSNGRLVQVAVKKAPLDRGSAPLASPVVTHVGVVFWIGADGLLSFQLGRHGPAAEWRAWPSGFTAVPFLRPYRSANGQLWAFGTYDDAEGMGRSAVCSVSTASALPEVRFLEGPHVSAGDHSYRGLGKHKRPWVDADEHIQPGLDMGDRWVLPIVTLPGGDTVIALVADSASRRDFLFRLESPPRPRLSTLFLHRPNAGIVPMGHSFDLLTTDDLDVFVREDRLNIYHRDTNECVSWRLV